MPGCDYLSSKLLSFESLYTTTSNRLFKRVHPTGAPFFYSTIPTMSLKISTNLISTFIGMYCCRSLLFTLLIVLSLPPSANAWLSFDQQVDNLIDNGSFILTRNNHIVAERNPEKLFIPASILKIVTSLASLSILGPEYRFQTELYLTKNNDLYIKGSGDPFLTSEEVRLILTALKEKGVTTINNILLDDTAFQLDSRSNGSRHSLNPYDASNSALAVNFNTIHIIQGQDGSIHSAEPQTPTLPIMQKLGADLSPGSHRINITRDKENIRIHSGELFRAIQYELNIAGNGSIAVQTAPANTSPFYTHVSSKNIQEIIPSLLLYSNNFIANQLFLACGMNKFGSPATWDKGRSAVKTFLKTLQISDSEFHIAEGAGLSPKNRITSQAMIVLLNAFKPYSRMMAKSHGNLVKSGTLTGVYSYAGYLLEEDKKHSFVIMLNQKRNTRSQLLELLQKPPTKNR
jgi:serine-type D-Ala-D-Ala carboxypeptidase/endopeptidase (penicillin-binding protein 4)